LHGPPRKYNSGMASPLPGWHWAGPITWPGTTYFAETLLENRIIKTAVIFAKNRGTQAGISEKVNYR
jgi:hypothetical protein